MPELSAVLESGPGGKEFMFHVGWKMKNHLKTRDSDDPAAAFITTSSRLHNRHYKVKKFDVLPHQLPFIWCYSRIHHCLQKKTSNCWRADFTGEALQGVCIFLPLCFIKSKQFKEFLCTDAAAWSRLCSLSTSRLRRRLRLVRGAPVRNHDGSRTNPDLFCSFMKMNI